MVLSVLSVCVTVLVLNIHLLGPLPDLPSWVHRMACCVNKRRHKANRNKVQDSKQMVENDKKTKSMKYEKPKHGGKTDSIDHCIFGEICKITDDLGEKVKEKEVEEKWKDLAKALNKFFALSFLFCFLSLVLICCIVLFS